MRLNVKRIINAIKKYEYISFDIFDTLIKRNVAHPTDVFNLIELEYEKKQNCKISSFKELRVTAEKLAREKSSKEDITFDDIYIELKEICNYDERIVEELKDIELQVEFSVCQKNEDFYPVYKYCLENRKKIVIVSDMYLKQDMLKKLLTINGITGFERLYVSSQTGLLKSTGSVYTHVLQDLGVRANQVVHIGDAKRGDFLRPRLKGIKSILIPHKLNYVKYYNGESLEGMERFMYDNLTAYINNNIPKEKDGYYKIGYEVLGPMLFGFSKWLENQLEEEKITKVFFLAREGLLMKKAFDVVKNTKIQTEYIYVSRRSLFVPALHQCNSLEELLQVLRVPRVESIKGFITRCGLDVNRYQQLMSNYGYTEDTIIQSVTSFTHFYQEIKNDIIENSLSEYENLIGYLQDKNMEGNIAVVDIGWHGSMQNTLTNIIEQLGSLVNIKGYYLGLTSNTQDVENKKGFAFNCGENAINEFKVMAGASLVETLFLAQHGTTIKYTKKDGGFFPVTAVSEYTDKETVNIVNLQDGAIHFVTDFSQSEIVDKIELSGIVSICSCNKLVTYPSKWDNDMFSNISFVNFGLGNITPSKGITYYIFHPKKLYKDFMDCGWKIAFMKKLFMIPLPYFKIYSLLKKRM